MLEQMGNKLLQLRKERKLTQKDAAEALEVTPTALSAYEKAQREPTLATIVRIAQYYGVSVDWLCGVSDERNDHDDNEKLSKADLIRNLTTICESGLPLRIGKRAVPSGDLNFESSKCIEARNIDCAYILLGSRWLSDFVEKYNKLLQLYLDGEIDIEMLNAWKEKKLSEYADDYVVQDVLISADDLPF